MGKSGILHGYGRFREVIAGGQKIHSGCLRAAFVFSDENGERLRVGVSVPKGAGNAVRRNRLKRLIRESVRRERRRVHLAAEQARSRVDIVFQFRSQARDRKLSLREILPDVQTICGKIAARLKHRV